jgi:hypothetical protein
MFISQEDVFVITDEDLELLESHEETSLIRICVHKYVETNEYVGDNSRIIVTF